MHTLPSIARSLELSATTLEDYNIDGLKKLRLNMHFLPETEDPCNLSSDIEELRVEFCRPNDMILPKNLRKLNINTLRGEKAIFESQRLLNLEYLRYAWSSIESFSETNLLVLNLKELSIASCHNLSDFEGLKQFQHLKHLRLRHCIYPVELFNGKDFPELKSFAYTGTYNRLLPKFEVPENFKNLTLTFPPNLKLLSIENAMFMKINLNTLKLPMTLTKLILSDTRLGDGYLELLENLEFIQIQVPKVAFKSNFRFPRMAVNATIKADQMIFEGTDFIHNLPAQLSHLILSAKYKGGIVPLTEKVKWPSLMKYFYLKKFLY